MKKEELIRWLYELTPLEKELKQIFQREGKLADEKTMFHMFLKRGGAPRDLQEEYLDFKIRGGQPELTANHMETEKIVNGRELPEENWFTEGEEISVRRHMRYMPAFRHQHRFIEAVYVVDGGGEQKMYLKNGEEHITLKAGDLCILPPDMQHELIVCEDQSVLINILIRSSTMQERLNQLVDQNHILFRFFLYTLYENETPNYILVHTGQDEQIRDLILEMVNEACEQMNYNQKVMVLMLGLLFTFIQRGYSGNISFSETITSGISYIPQILLYIEKNYATTSVEEIAEHFSFSRSYLSRIFRCHTEKTVMDILTEVRISKACEGLKNTNLTVRMIAERVGYEDVTYFNRIFRKTTGMTPTAYRKKQTGG